MTIERCNWDARAHRAFVCPGSSHSDERLVEAQEGAARFRDGAQHNRGQGLMGSRLFREQESAGSTPASPTMRASSNGRAAVLQTADGCSIHSARTTPLPVPGSSGEGGPALTRCRWGSSPHPGTSFVAVGVIVQPGGRGVRIAEIGVRVPVTPRADRPEGGHETGSLEIRVRVPVGPRIRSAEEAPQAKCGFDSRRGRHALVA